mmetsp:Transcript_1176/g.2688  ORF Transcript_1176/g.2688 Transcript_1176/m.2688 type:complete len:111 (-) Transcript_1176:738-1070(-)|eukprot:CAMPEP_0168207110 /NCGR_PEP_ID=MMETSP0140_2-20121125/1325_1 /TAXON_ID=44445 /ORGANISM="Pseudo-nitzschia australis, Strain 10249 10 AB" /LENGTH=110 /DNA_ID=CAMNT_0008133349 /DNA_START=517 /DNA_END=849 /DNA_ORIENTATION=-
MIGNGRIYNKNKGKFFIELVEKVASTTPIAEPPSVPEVALPTSVIPKLHVVLFQQSRSYYLEKISATREWCVRAEEAIALIKQKGLVTGLVGKMEEINSEESFFARKVHV